MAKRPPKGDKGPWPKEGLFRGDGAPACGAKSRKGSACMMIPAGGNRRCRLHGGASPGKDAQVLVAQAAGVPMNAVQARAVVRVVGDVRPEDPEVLDMRSTIAQMLSLTNAARKLALDTSTADELIQQLADAGLSVDDDLQTQLQEALGELQFDRAMKLVDRLGKVGSVQTNALKVQQVGNLLMQQILPTLADFAARIAKAAERFIPADQHAEWRIEARRIQGETQDRVVRQTAEAQGVGGR